MPYSPRDVLKQLVKFAKREFREKRPLTVQVLRVKEEHVYSKGGSIPTITVSKTQIPYYLVVVEYGEEYRIYNFSKSGVLINGENVEKSSKKIAQIEKLTKLEYKIEK